MNPWINSKNDQFTLQLSINSWINWFYFDGNLWKVKRINLSNLWEKNLIGIIHCKFANLQIYKYTLWTFKKIIPYGIINYCWSNTIIPGLKDYFCIFIQFLTILFQYVFFVLYMDLNLPYKTKCPNRYSFAP